MSPAVPYYDIRVDELYTAFTHATVGDEKKLLPKPKKTTSDDKIVVVVPKTAVKKTTTERSQKPAPTETKETKETSIMTTVEPTDKPAAAKAAEAPKGTFKRDALRENEIAVQAQWEQAKVFEADPDPSKESFMVTFPYPYSNGHLHIGHAFSLTKAVFRAQYERHQGKNVLFPFAFHCTGMPIQAVRDTC
jgi:FtsZ-interacting cell division protein ZipA